MNIYYRVYMGNEFEYLNSYSYKHLIQSFVSIKQHSKLSLNVIYNEIFCVCFNIYNVWMKITVVDSEQEFTS